MINLLLRLSELGGPVYAAATGAVEVLNTPVEIGFIVLAVIIGPVIILTMVSIFGHPRMFRVSGLFVGSLVILIGAMIAGFLLGGMLLQLIVPQ